jgi:hypothetical protein
MKTTQPDFTSKIDRFQHLPPACDGQTALRCPLMFATFTWTLRLTDDTKIAPGLYITGLYTICEGDDR